MLKKIIVVVVLCIILFVAVDKIPYTINYFGLLTRPLDEITQHNNHEGKQQTSVLINQNGKTLCERVKVPDGFKRTEVNEDSFGHYLRNLPLKPHASKVMYYNGTVKSRDVYEAVVDMDIGTRDLQQCADAVIRLRAEYLYSKGRFNDIHFNFTSGFCADYAKWMEGYRISVDGNNVKWTKTANYSNDYQAFRKYLDIVFAYAGTLSLSKELVAVPVEDMEIGDVFIQGGSPGHCAIIVDIAESPTSNQKVFMLAQSYMPAQDIHILKNPKQQELSPWYPLDFGDELFTPEWTFKRNDLKRFKD